jgi:hypothetical protein
MYATPRRVMSGKSPIEGDAIVIWETQSNTKLLATGLERAPCDLEVERRPDEIGDLSGVLQHGAKDSYDVWRAVGTQAQGCGWRQSPVSGINDDSASSKRNAMLGSNLGRNM